MKVYLLVYTNNSRERIDNRVFVDCEAAKEFARSQVEDHDGIRVEALDVDDAATIWSSGVSDPDGPCDSCHQFSINLNDLGKERICTPCLQKGLQDGTYKFETVDP